MRSSLYDVLFLIFLIDHCCPLFSFLRSGSVFSTSIDLDTAFL